MSTFSSLRSILTKEASQETWQEIIAELNKWLQYQPSNHEKQIIFDYLNNHLSNWDDNIRHLNDVSVHPDPHPLLPIARSIRLRKSKLSYISSRAVKVLNHHKISVLDLTRRNALTHFSIKEQIPSLKSLFIGENYIEQLDSLEQLPNLEELVMQECQSLTSGDGLETLQNLQSLQLYGCSQLRNLPSLRFLKEVVLTNAAKLQSFDFLSENAKLRTIEVNEANIPKELHLAETCTNIDLQNCQNLRTIQTNSPLTSLQTLNIQWCNNFEGNYFFEEQQLPALTECNIPYHLTQDKSLELELPRLKKLSLEIIQSNDLGNLPNLSKCTELKDLRVTFLPNNFFFEGSKPKRNAEQFGLLPSLESLRLSGGSWTAGTFLFPNTETIQFENSFIESFSCLSKCTKLTKLVLDNAWGFVDFHGFPETTMLTYLSISQVNIRGFEGIANISELETLVCRECYHITSVLPLLDLEKLESLILTNLTSLPHFSQQNDWAPGREPTYRFDVRGHEKINNFCLQYTEHEDLKRTNK